MVNIFPWCFLVLAHFAIHCNGQRFLKDFYNEGGIMIDIRVPRGSNITLQCEADKCKLHPHYHIISWTFAGDKILLNKTCVDLELTNVTINLSGIYTCSLNNVLSHVYQVEVIEPLHYDSALPRVLSVTPSNTTVPQYSNIVVQCRTSSSARVPPHVFWFKRTTSTGTAVRDVLTYRNHSYVRISDGSSAGGGFAGSPHSVQNERNVYLSKLSIHNATVKDSGVYACVAITELGRDLQYFVVEVVTTTVPPRVTETLSLLFLIPFSFALIPSIVWLCYSRCYHRKQKAKCKLAAAEAALAASAPSSSLSANHRQDSCVHAHNHYQHHRPHPGGNMIQMLRMGDGAPSIASAHSIPECKRLLTSIPMTQQTVSVV